jgi:hypothetical protein
MADKNKFEEMLERLINEDKTGAEELFHEIVVEKSRSIYENLLAEEYDEEGEDGDEVEEGSYDKKKKSKKHDDDEMEEGFDLDDFEVAEEEDEEDPMAAMGGDETDDLEMDVGMDDGDGEMSIDDEEGDEELEDRVVDLEDALDDLKSEFEQMMSDEDGESSDEDSDMDDDEEGEDDADMDMDMDMDSDDGGEEETEEESFDPTDQVATMREYVEKVTAKMGDDGANTQSAVAGPNDMGGTADNIARGDTENGVEANKGNLKGSGLSDQNPKDMNTGNVNVPGGKAGKSMKNMPKGHGAEKKGSGESGADAHSTLGSKK